MSYYFTLNYPKNLKPCSVSDLLKTLLIPRKWRHYLRSDQKVLINGCYRSVNQLVYPNDKIELTLDRVESRQSNYPSSSNLPDIIYEDANLLVINKPAGQKTHPNQGETNTALNDCATYLGRSPYIVHRLDMLTSGLLLVAKNPAVVPILNRELTTKIFQREYLATVAHADKLAGTGSIRQPLGHDPHDQRKRMVQPDGLAAVTHYHIIRYMPDNTALVKLTLETGRTHQIRVHLASLGSPIVGDPLYNSEFQQGEFLHLTAYRMSFIKPFSFDKVQVELPNAKRRF
ncbi:RluA family pseudouridine synthase [Lactobacillus sp. ESL0681]|uniref:RluA family pseudouridine synthase n=1 Tax=Lactobacillus sp. ESL0681 TaxID=2983211 RepID=UPI0023F9D3C9|nr:RluA family pseudouridine synthase [Lactobacillus sp. ESL0681]WEV40961.1 RluA family pseudouridine synthase [Lactobacillus sp. ESL0681]